MNKNFAIIATAFLLSAARVLAVEPAAAAPASDWSFSVSPYVWVAAVQVDTTLDSSPTPPPSPSPAPPSSDRYETKLGGGALLAAQVHYKSVGLWVDFVWVQTDSSAVQSGPLYSAKELETNFYHSTVAFSYVLPTTGNFHAEVIGGARFWSIDAEITAQAGLLPGFTAQQKETWVTPVIGIDLRYDLNPRWSLLAKGTVGVFDDNSDGWEAMGGVAYHFGDTWSAMLGYRYLHEEYARQRFSYATDVSGAVLGASWRF